MMQFSSSQRRWLIAIAVLIIGGFFIIRHLMAPTPVQFQTVKVANRDLQQNVLATGKLDAVRKVDVGAQV
ncbi:macrolide transporter subunit MacA, partial [Yersinia enterocolitica]|nr:macrolide transporter subunit MacA [Yersinia enterocolitica]